MSPSTPDAILPLGNGQRLGVSRPDDVVPFGEASYILGLHSDATRAAPEAEWPRRHLIALAVAGARAVDLDADALMHLLGGQSIALDRWDDAFIRSRLFSPTPRSACELPEPDCRPRWSRRDIGGSAE